MKHLTDIILDFLEKAGLYKKRKTECSGEFDIELKNDTDREEFTRSLNLLEPEDIDVHAQRTKKKSTGAVIRKIILIISVTVFICCAIYLIKTVIGQKNGSDYYDNLASEWDNIIADDSDDGAIKRISGIVPANRILCLKDKLKSGNVEEITSYDSRTDEMRAKLSSLAATFPTLYGWIYIENTAINYPIVQGGDNEFYLDHLPDGSKHINGSIYADYRNNKTIMRNFNTVMYGHNLTGGGMFHDVTKFKDKNFFDTTEIYIYTLDGAYVYKPFAIYEANSQYQYFRTEFATTAEFVNFAYEMKSNSMFATDTEFSANDRIITLSTCTNGAASGRYALQAKLIKVIG